MNHLSPEQLAVYRTSAQGRENQAKQRLLTRQQLGMAVAQAAATLLKSRFRVDRVALFGSLLDLQRMHAHSDIDLAVWGLDPKDYYRALGELLDLSDFSIDLVQVEFAAPKIQQAIQSQSLEL